MLVKVQLCSGLLSYLLPDSTAGKSGIRRNDLLLHSANKMFVARRGQEYTVAAMKPSKLSKASVTFKHSVPVEVRLPKFHPFNSFKSLDRKRLSKGTSTIEIGCLEGGCCQKLVRATVRNGMVVGIGVDPCESTRKASPELAALLKKARREILPRSGGKWKPIPLKDFGPATIDDIVIHNGCIQICIFSYCLTCCVSASGFGCTTDPIYIGPLSVARNF